MTALLPCPFCERRPHQNLGPTRRCQMHGEPLQDFIIKCPAGCAQAIAPTKELACAKWNRRAPSAEARAAEDAMREAVEAAYREGFEERGWNLDADADMCWRESNARRALPLTGDGGRDGVA